MDTKLSIRECIRFGWETFKKRPWFLVGVTALILFINIIIPTAEDHQPLSLYLLITVISFLLSVFVELGVLSFALRAHDSIEGAKLADLWRPELYVRFLCTMVIVTALVGIGIIAPLGLAVAFSGIMGYASGIFLLLLIPAIMFAIAISLASYLTVDTNVMGVAALKESARLTKGNRLQLFFLIIVVLLINVAGLICLLVGLLVTLPITVLAMVHAYRTLEHAKSSIVTA